MTRPTRPEVKIGYVVTDEGKVYVQGPDASRSGVALYSDDQSWTEGLGCTHGWELVADDDPRVSKADRKRLSCVLADLRANRG
jgi:hypothetical protein